MKAVVGLLLMLLKVSQGVETQCDGRQDGAQCYGAVGGTVALQLMDSAVGLFRYSWKFNNTKTIFTRRKNTPVNLTDDRYSFTPSNGTFRMNNLRRSDGGEYTLNIFDSNGTNTEKRTLQLVVQAPVSSVRLVSECLSQGEMRVSCLSEGGDSPQYSWTLDGHTLTDAELLTGHNETNNITLKQHVSGRLACSVRNHVSDVLKQQMISTCGFTFINCTSDGKHISQWVFAANNTLCIEPTTASITSPESSTMGKETGLTESSTFTAFNQTMPNTRSNLQWYIMMAGVLGALVFFLVVGTTAVVCIQKKKKTNLPKEETDEQELTYADVRILQRQGLQVKQREEVEVEYGQVKFSERPQQIADDDSVYAKVRKNR
ncbi:T-cell surface antigen CD2-like isoform X3 [Echeneis naucrates]|uniref:T-cell surface antigen CD2-like isoform X3 n=1 Tax=Echeneis naucrates TaxID=173247 RepID=UPI00111430A9|nr:T-cell surface antigen CD2-like isoform X3 [Echeneis naucrates]XP_029368950.1 T-cell surface antigen CD2-like isoform X3 [Echeneis naucrates]